MWSSVWRRWRRRCITDDRRSSTRTKGHSSFTSQEFTGRLTAESIAISMDGKGRAIDNVMIERLWRTVKYENIYIKEYTSGADCHQGLQAYFQYY